LENTVERAVILARNGVLNIDAGMLRGNTTGGRADQQTMSRERETVEAALRASRGKVSGENGAAKKLGLPASTVEFRIKKLGIDKFRYRTC
jgi:formate hydrogenlyase transcriptional activator